MKLASILPRRMMARLALVVAAALAIEFAGNSYLSALQEREVVSEERIRRFAEHLATAGQIASRVEPPRRPALMADIAIQGMTLNWVPRTVITDSGGSHPQLARMRNRMNEAAPDLARQELRLSVIPSEHGRRRDLLGALRLPDGSFVTFRIRPFLGASPSFVTTALLHLVFVTIVLGAALLMTWTLVRPLGELARAADATGRGSRPEIRVRGPWEVRRVASAFRAMQDRVLKMMEDHTQALVAVSHDLRTPIQRLRLRLALPLDGDTRAAMDRDLAEMEKFIASITDFIRSGLEEEDRLVDLAALAMTIVDNAADAGFAIEYDGPDEAPVWLKPLAMKRILANLVENACRHADRVQVVLRPGPPVTLSVEDDGPGIPADRRAEAFLPFQRIHAQRAGESEGSGLGLAIVWNAVTALDAQITLEDSPLGGLAARIVLPGTDRDGNLTKV